MIDIKNLDHATSERYASALKGVKTFSRSTASQDCLSALALLSVEKPMIENIINFNDKVTDKFASHKDRRIEFLYKQYSK
jgi:hypothetical protein